MTIVIMGVAGCGKSTIGKMLAQKLSLPFIEADNFHPNENVLKMSKGIPLTDEDRLPWLNTLAGELQLHEKQKGSVLACSALKEVYRQILQHGVHEKISWIYLQGNEETLRTRMQNRKGHFMPEGLLKSQLLILEEPSYAYCFSIEKEPQEIVNDFLTKMKR